MCVFFFFQAEDGIRDGHVTGVQTCALPIFHPSPKDLYGNEVGEPEYDVLTELWYQDRETFEKAHRGLERHPERVAEIIADEETLFDRSRSRVAFVEDRVSDLAASRSRADLERDVRRLVDK